MATKYSSLYGINPSDPANFIYKGPQPLRKGDVTVRYIEFTGTLMAADVLKLCKLTNGEKLIGIFNGRSGDPDVANDATVNIGTIGAPTSVAAASTGMQGVVKLEFTPGDLINIAPIASDNEELQLVIAAGGLEVSVTHRFLIKTIVA